MIMKEDELIILAAEELYRTGFLELSLTKLSKLAKCSKSKIYGTFKDKNDLVAQVYLYWLEKRISTSIKIEEDYLLSTSEKLMCYFLYRIYEERMKPQELGLQEMPSCRFLWKNISRSTLEDVIRKLKYIHYIPKNIIKSDMSLKEKFNEEELEIFVVKLMAIERGYIAIFNNIELRHIALKIPINEIVKKISYELEIFGITTTNISINNSISWVENNINY